MKQNRVVVRTLAIMLTVFAASLFAQSLGGSSGAWTSTLKKDFAMDPGSNLVMRCESGDISVASWDKKSVQVVETVILEVITREEAAAILDKISGGYRQEGATLTISSEGLTRGLMEGKANSGSRKSIFNRGSEVRHQYEILLPRKFNLDLRTAAGDMEIRKVDGRAALTTGGGDVLLDGLTGVIEVRTAGGDMDLGAISGQINAATSGGDIAARMIYAEGSISTSGGDISLQKSSQRLSINTSGGDITLADIAGPISANTSGGDIELSNFSGSEGILNTTGGDLTVLKSEGRLDLSTSGGDIECKDIGKSLHARTTGGEVVVEDLRAEAELMSSGGDVAVEMTLRDFSVPHGLRLESMGGDIELTLPSRLPATIEAEVRLQRRKDAGDRDDIYSDFPLSQPAPDETNDRFLRSKGEINGGGDRIFLKTTGGDITIKKGE